MNYETATAFRRALESRLLAESNQTGTPLVRLRKLVVFDRFLARLVYAHPGRWLLKGGLALQLRLGAHARTTQDIDVLATLPHAAVARAITEAVTVDLGDWFTFQLRPTPGALAGVAPEGGQRFFLSASVDFRLFERFHVDVGVEDPVVEPPQSLSTPPLLAFAGIRPATIDCYPISQHLAEKVHAYVRPRASGEGTRVKDLVDIVLIAMHISLEAGALRQALAATFLAHGDAELPVRLPEPPSDWNAKYARLAAEIGVDETAVAGGFAQASRFVNPVLTGLASGTWSPREQRWVEME